MPVPPTLPSDPAASDPAAPDPAAPDPAAPDPAGAPQREDAAARVARVDRSACDLLHADGSTSRASGLRGMDVTVGDLVIARDGAVVEVLPRRSLLARGSAGADSRVQPLAANVDTVLLCAGLPASAGATVPLRRLERLLTLAWDSGATPVVVLTKADLCADVPEAVRATRRHAPGVDVAVVAAATGDVTALAAYDVDGATLVLLGASGAGKSTVVNALAGRQAMVTGHARQVDGKGRHTTTHRELLVLPSGAVVIDTPGLRAVGLQGGAQSLARAFSDVEELAVACRFADCAHDSEPGCAVAASVQAGDMAGERVQSWRRLQRELAFQERRGDARLQAAEKARWKPVHRSQGERGGRP